MKLAVGACAFALLSATPAFAMPVAPMTLCNTYPEAPACIAGVPACTFCHNGAPPPRNAFGQLVEAALLPGAARPLSSVEFTEALPDALRAVEDLDADQDGYTNLDEIMAGTLPADIGSKPDDLAGPCGSNTRWNLCGYDARYVLKKIRLDFCGRSPTYEELEAVSPTGDSNAALHAALEECLDTEFWMGKNGQLWQLAHRKIRPLKAIKQGEDAGPIPLGDYYDDYALFAWSQIDDHDARDVLVADYFVSRQAPDGPSGSTRYAVAGANDPTGAQDVERARRAGLLTTRWNLVLNVMFTALPRTAAAQAYRAFLGKDIAKLQGLAGITGEPVDYDDKGVTADACMVCHSTLDPASYPFKNYQGLTGDVGTYDPNRIANDFRNDGEDILAMPEAGYVLGQPVQDLVEWAQVAADSDEFAAATVLDYWRLLLGHEPTASEQDEFRTLWQDFRGAHAYSVERMLHALIETEAYGVP